ncbi:hypothetical protein ASPBRDRAFT_57781 [Aspergillus brasiliensis CBS 101740]|uniref:Protein kinase domain-containing protein n=1 Tax=Aspergillus brasiliensis (strain CBS 101740 / IMI 381727 / IBT 21946) TaxID=767769 RepID=A0A1L9U9M7_ASPBC|nr:hypothetical protein ASPBRDRAFT_57781 [Aspergillus brasiliensis CBS 101740]
MALNLPNHRIVESEIDTDSVFLVIMSRAVLFEITLRASNFLGTPFETETKEWFYKVNAREEATDSEEAPDDSEVLDEFWDWLVLPCAEYIRRNAPVIHEPISLQKFAFPPTHPLRLLPVDGIITAVPTGGERLSESTLSTISASIAGLPPTVRKVSAADVLIYQNLDSEFDHTCDIPRRVKVAEHDPYFKTVIDAGDFIREVSALSRISELGLSINVSKLYAIVLSEDEQLILGILMDWLPFGSQTLETERFIQMKESHVKWERQIRDIVKVLHSNNIVWGDVHPGNILIDYELNAWVVDFGGGYQEEFINREVAGTKQGDLEGIHNVFCKWLPRWYLELQPNTGFDAD